MVFDSDHDDNRIGNDFIKGSSLMKRKEDAKEIEEEKTKETALEEEEKEEGKKSGGPEHKELFEPGSWPAETVLTSERLKGWKETQEGQAKAKEQRTRQERKHDIDLRIRLVKNKVSISDWA